MVVGASSSGTQIANEIQRSGRPVTLSIGEHIRAPRMYRGRDLEWWMDAAGVLDERYDQIEDITRARRVPSFQLAGTPDRSTLDLNALTAAGVKLDVQQDPSRMRAVDRPMLKASTQKLKLVTNWTPTMSLTQSMQRAWASRVEDGFA